MTITYITNYIDHKFFCENFIYTMYKVYRRIGGLLSRGGEDWTKSNQSDL